IAEALGGVAAAAARGADVGLDCLLALALAFQTLRNLEGACGDRRAAARLRLALPVALERREAVALGLLCRLPLHRFALRLLRFPEQLLPLGFECRNAIALRSDLRLLGLRELDVFGSLQIGLRPGVRRELLLLGGLGHFRLRPQLGVPPCKLGGSLLLPREIARLLRPGFRRACLLQREARLLFLLLGLRELLGLLLRVLELLLHGRELLLGALVAAAHEVKRDDPDRHRDQGNEHGNLDLLLPATGSRFGRGDALFQLGLAPRELVARLLFRLGALGFLLGFALGARLRFGLVAGFGLRRGFRLGFGPRPGFGLPLRFGIGFALLELGLAPRELGSGLLLRLLRLLARVLRCLLPRLLGLALGELRRFAPR